MSAPNGLLSLEVDESSTIVLPAQLTGEDRVQWLAGAVARARAASSHWTSALATLVPDIVAHALDRRADDGIVVQYWSPVFEVVAVVRIALLPSPGVDQVARELRAQRGSRVEHVSGAGLGSGAEWLYTDVLPGFDVAPDDEPSLIGAQFVFADDEVLVLVTLDPMLAPHAALALDDVRALVRTISLDRDGTAWLAPALPDEVGTRAEVEPWPLLEHRGGE